MDKRILTLFSTSKALCQNSKSEPFNVSIDDSKNPIQSNPNTKSVLIPLLKWKNQHNNKAKAGTWVQLSGSGHQFLPESYSWVSSFRDPWSPG